MSDLRGESWLPVASWLGSSTGFPRVAFLALGILVPVHLPYMATLADDGKVLGWESRPVGDVDVSSVWITYSTGLLRVAGLLPGDRVIRIEGRPATPATVSDVRAAAEAGDTLELVLERRDETFVVRAPVRASSVSYFAYRWARLPLAVISWIVGLTLLLFRGGQLAGLLLGAGMLLIPPAMFPVAMPQATGLMWFSNVSWHILATGYSVFFPALIVHFLCVHAPESHWTRDRRLWTAIYLALLPIVVVSTNAFREVLAWSTGGFEQNVRMIVGLVCDVVAIVALVLAGRRRTGYLPTHVRWLAFALLLFLLTGSSQSLAQLTGITGVVDVLRQVRALTLAPVIALAAVYLIASHSADDVSAKRWEARRRAASFAAAGLTVLYGLIVVGAAAIALIANRSNLNGGEWIVFGAVFCGAILFSPVLRWARDLVDRHLFAEWIALEERVGELMKRIGAELEPARIAGAVSKDLPPLLHLSSASLVLASDVCEQWGIGRSGNMATCSRLEVARQLADRASRPHLLIQPLQGADGQVLGFIRFERARHDRELESPERTLLQGVAQGVSSALRNAETYMRLRTAQRDLAESERVASLGALAGGLAHEIKNPLASLKLGIQILGQRDIDDVRFHRMQQDIKRIDDLVTGLLRFTHEDALETNDVLNLEHLVRKCAEEFKDRAQDCGVALRVEPFPAESIWVAGDSRQLELIVSNLISNALTAAGASGNVTVRLRRRRKGAELTVLDDGPGIPRALRDAVFKLDFSTTPGGTGLGLALARREVERLGGNIRIDSMRGNGTLLRVWLPGAKVGESVLPTA